MFMQNQLAKLCSGLVMAAAIWGCDGSLESNEGPNDEDRSEEELQPFIVNGHACAGWVKKSIVGMGLDSGQRPLHDQSRCTGTLIAPNVVLTARHCVARLIDTSSATESECEADGNPNRAVRYGRASTRTVYVFNDMNSASLAKAILPIVPAENSLCNNDIALLVLDRPLQNKTPAAIRGLSPRSTNGPKSEDSAATGGREYFFWSVMQQLTTYLWGPVLRQKDGSSSRISLKELRRSMQCHSRSYWLMTEMKTAR